MLTDLLAGRHFNIEERVTRGAWPHEPLRFCDLVAHLATVLAARRWFPRPWIERPADWPVGDRTVVENQGGHRYVVRFERSGPSMNLAEAGERVFLTARDAAEFYLRAELNLPGDLDSWKVVE
jgi:hypothetical protein